MTSGENPSKVKVWWQALRYHYVPPSIFPAVLGGLVSWASNGKFFLFYFLLVLVAIIINHLALNMTDDYFDYKHSVDNLKLGEKNPYTGGSRTLSGGLLKPSSMFKAFSLCYLFVVIVGIYLTLTRGLPILAFGLVGVFCAVFYTAPPIKFGHHSLGELAMLACFGPVIGLGAFFVQSQSLTLEAFFATLPMGIMLFSMIIINELPDLEEDRAAGKLTLVARYGKKAGVKLYLISWAFTYVIIVGAALARVIPVFALLALISLPLVYSSIRTLRIHYDSPSLLAPANLNMIKAHGVTSLGLIAGYAIQGLFNGADALQLVVILLSVTVAYAPVAVTLFRASTRKK